MREPRLLLVLAIGICLALGVVSNLVPTVECGPPESPSARVLIVDNSLSRPIYVPERPWGCYLGDVPYDVVHVPDGEEIPPVADYTHMILSGSTASLVTPPRSGRPSRSTS